MADADQEYRSHAALGERLRALPQQAPDVDLWPALAAHVAAVSAAASIARRRRSRWPWWLATAASVLLVVALALLPRQPMPIGDAIVAEVKTTDDASLVWLQQRSGQLEGWLADLPSVPVRDDRQLMAAVEVEDLIALVDVQLDAARDAGEAMPLWRQRVALLEDLSLLRSAAFSPVASREAVAFDQPNLL